MTLIKSPFYRIGLSVLLVLSIPLLAMQFTKEVNWSVFDFALMGVLLVILASTIELARHYSKNKRSALIIIVLAIVLFLLLWVEIAVGLVGSPIAGS